MNFYRGGNVLPARNITNRGSKKKIGFFPSEKNGRPTAWESLIERDYMYLLEFDSYVISYTEQPMTIFYKYNGREYKYTPDLLVVRKDKTLLIEVKPKEKHLKLLEEGKYKAKLTVANSFAKSHNYEFKVVTDEDIRAGDLLSNIKYLFKFSRIHVPSSEFLKIRNELLLSGELTIDEISQRLANSPLEKKRVKTYVLALLYSQKLITDLHKKINSSSLVRLP
jgi:hypothetical protein